MKVFLQTFRYGIQQQLVYHCRTYSYDGPNGVLHVTCPVEDSGNVAIAAIVTITAGDTLLTVACEETCELHGSDDKILIQKSVLK